MALPPCWAPRKPACQPPSNTSVFAVEHQEASRFPWVPAVLPELQPNPCPRYKPPMQVSGRCIPSSAQSHRCSGGTLSPVHYNAQLVYKSKQASDQLGSKAALCPGGCRGIKRGIINKKKKALEEKKYSLTSLMLSKQTKVYGATALCSPLGPAAHIYCSFFLNSKKASQGMALGRASCGHTGRNGNLTDPEAACACVRAQPGDPSPPLQTASRFQLQLPAQGAGGGSAGRPRPVLRAWDRVRGEPPW